MIASLTRLTIGGLLAGYDGLTKRLLVWEKEIDLKVAQEAQDGLRDEKLPGPKESSTDHLRYAAIGMIFNVGEVLDKSLENVYQLSARAGDRLEVVVNPVYSSRFFSPIRSRVDSLAEYGQSLVDDWIERGRAEEARSRSLVNTALVEQVDSSIEYLTSNDEVQELVKSQSVGLVGEIIEETRERTVSADNYLEAWARTMLRKPLRPDPLAPAPEVKARAAPPRRLQGKVVNK
jgi:hypothetical protein